MNPRALVQPIDVDQQVLNDINYGLIAYGCIWDLEENLKNLEKSDDFAENAGGTPRLAVKEWEFLWNIQSSNFIPHGLLELTFTVR